MVEEKNRTKTPTQEENITASGSNIKGKERELIIYELNQLTKGTKSTQKTEEEICGKGIFYSGIGKISGKISVFREQVDCDGHYCNFCGKTINHGFFRAVFNADQFIYYFSNIVGGDLVACPSCYYSDAEEKAYEIRKKREKKRITDIVRKGLEKERTEIKQLITRAVEKWEEEKQELQDENQELKKQLNETANKSEKIKKALEERERKEREKEKAEKEREAEQARLQRETQKALLSAEKTEIEQLKSERNELRTTTEEQEKFLTRWIKEYERLELEKKEVIHQILKYDAIIKQRDSEIKQINAKLSKTEIEKAEREVANTGLIERKKNLEKSLADIKAKRDEWEQKHNALELQINDYQRAKEQAEKERNEAISRAEQAEKDKKQAEQDRDHAIHMKRIGMLGNIAQGAIDWLPIPKKWQTGLKTGIQAASAWALFKDLPNWTYEGLIMLVGVGLWYFVIYFLRKINRIIFGKKEKKQVSNIEKALTNIIEAGAIGKGRKKIKEFTSEEKPGTIIIQNSPPTISKEPVKPEEILTQISSDTIPKEKEPQEQEKSESE